MAAKKNDYLVELRNQIDDVINMEELTELAFDLHLDWDNLQGTKKNRASKI